MKGGAAMEKTINTADSHMSPEDTVKDFCNRNGVDFSAGSFADSDSEAEKNVCEWRD